MSILAREWAQQEVKQATPRSRETHKLLDGVFSMDLIRSGIKLPDKSGKCKRSKNKHKNDDHQGRPEKFTAARDCASLPKATSQRPNTGKGSHSISQFSAPTLRRPFECPSGRPPTNGLASNHYNHQQQASAQAPTSVMLMRAERKDSHGNLSSVARAAAAARDASGASIPAPDLCSSVGGASLLSLSSHREALSFNGSSSCCCWCCCCTNKCAAPKRPISSAKRSDATDLSLSQPRTMGAANQLTCRFNVDGVAAGRGAGPKRRWQRTTTRMLIPVPPPIVPLHKQLACRLGDSLDTFDVYEKSGSLQPQKSMTFRLAEAADSRPFSPHDKPDGQCNLLADDPIVATTIGQPTPDRAASKVSYIGSPDRYGAMTTTDDQCEGNWIGFSQGAVIELHGDGQRDRSHFQRPSTQSSPTNPKRSSSSSSSSNDASSNHSSDHHLEDKNILKLKHGTEPSSSVWKNSLAKVASRLQASTNPFPALIAWSNNIASDPADLSVAEIKLAPAAAASIGKEGVDKGNFPLDIPNQQPVIANVDLRFPCARKIAEVNNGGFGERGDNRTPVVDIEFQIRENSLDSGWPQAIIETPTLTTSPTAAVAAVAMPIWLERPSIFGEQQQQQQYPLSAIYDLPESGGAREFVRVELSDGKRTVTARRLPLRPARRPSMPPPAPPPQPQREVRSMAAAQRAPFAGSDRELGPNSGCVAANFSTGRAPNSTVDVSAPSSTVKIPPKFKYKRPNRLGQQEISTNTPVINGTQLQSESKREENPNRASIELLSHEKESPTKANQALQQQQQHQVHASKVLACHREPITNPPACDRAFDVGGTNDKHPSYRIAIEQAKWQSAAHVATANESSQCDKPNGASSTGGKQVRSNYKRETSSEKETYSRAEGLDLEVANDTYPFNMGSSHSSSVAGPTVTAASETEQPQTATICTKVEPDKRSLTKAQTREERKRNDRRAETTANSNKGKQSKRPSAADPTAATTETPHVIKSLANMTNRLVGEAKIMTCSSRDADEQQHQGEPVDAVDGRRQHVQSALQARIKGVVRPMAPRNSQQITTQTAGPKRTANINGNQNRGHLLERPGQGATEDSLERRRKSLQDGDVFIYPRLYKDLNECRKCLRDNRICNCIEIELSSDGSVASHTETNVGAKNGPSEVVASGAGPITPQANSHNHPVDSSSNNNNNKALDKCLSRFIDQSDARGQQSGDQEQSSRFASTTHSSTPKHTTKDENNNNNIDGLASELNLNQVNEQKSAPAKWLNSSQSANGSEGPSPESPPPEPLSSELAQEAAMQSSMERPNCTSIRSEPDPCLMRGSLNEESPTRRASSHLDIEQSQLLRTSTKKDSKITTISIGGPNRAQWQEAQVGDEEANNNLMIFTKNHSGADADKDSSSGGDKEQPHTSVVSIQTRRRNMASTKLEGRRAIYENQDPMELNDCAFEEPNKVTCTSVVPLNLSHGLADGPPLLDRQLLPSESIIIRDSLSPICKDDGSGGSGVLDYSPILSSVRDYIKNMNTELQVQTSVASAHRTEGSNITLVGSNHLDLESASGVVQGVSSAVDLVVSSASTIPRSMASTLCDLATPIQVVTSSGTGIVQTTFTTALPAASIMAHVQTAASCVGAVDANLSPKKSIFDGASKDEILEYLEDARERVPEILMAADDVMVISENELIVVDQLDPNSPATPISIVEADQVTSVTGSGGANSADGQPTNMSHHANCSSLMRTSSKSNQHHYQSLTHPDQLRQHLQQMYQTSQLAAAAAAAVASAAQSATSTGAIEDNSGLGPTEGAISLAEPLEELCPSPNLGADVGDTDLHSMRGRIDSPDFGLLDKDSQVFGAHTTKDRIFERSSGMPQQQKQQAADQMTSNARDENIAAAMVSQPCGLLNFAGPIYVGRRNSVSASSGQATGGRESALQILALQKRYSNNRNSLSSPSSSPTSSTSPSSSSSSNRTSGNCSAATSFYASSSLSCSSPLLNLNGTFTSSSSPAFNQSVPPSQPPPQLQQHPQIGESKASPPACKLDAGQSSNRATPDLSDQTLREHLLLMSHQDAIAQTNVIGAASFILNRPALVDRDDSGIGSEPVTTNRLRSMTISGEQTTPRHGPALASERQMIGGKLGQATRSNSETVHLTSANNRGDAPISAAKLSRIDESGSATLKHSIDQPLVSSSKFAAPKLSSSSNARFSTQPTGNKNSGLGIGGSRGIHGHYNTLNRLNNYFMNRHPFSNSSESTVEFQCLDCDQFIDVDQATIMNKTNELRLLRATDCEGRLDCSQPGGDGREMTSDQLDRAYVAAMNGLPLCKSCEKKRIERKEIISEFVETELKYGRDLKIIHDEFYRPMQIAGLLSKDQIGGVFLNLEELIMAHCKFADRLESAIREAHSIGDTDFNTVNIGGLFVESADMLNTFESYCIRQGAAACLLARLAKERELLRIFLRVSQMENTLLRRMNLAAFLMVPVQRVTKYPLLLNRLYKVTAYHHKDRECLRDAQLKVELHLEHINQQTKGIGASNKIWRRISSLSAPISSNRRGLMNAEDIGYIKLRKTAMDMLKWDRDETQFIHSGKLHFAPLTEYLTRQKMKPLRYLPAHALLIVLGRPNWKYRPDLVKATLDSKLMTPTPGGNGIKEAALLLFREKNGRFVPCREPLLLSNCVLSADCSQFNSECPQNQQASMARQPMNSTPQQQQHNSSTGSRKSCSSNPGELAVTSNDSSHKSEPRHAAESGSGGGGSLTGSIDSTTTNRSISPKDQSASSDSRAGSLGGDIALISSLRSLIEVDSGGAAPLSGGGSPPEASAHSSRSFSLASALPRATPTTTNSTSNLSKPILSTAASNLTILNQLMTKVNSYHSRQSTSGNQQSKQAAPVSASTDHQFNANKNRPVSPSASVDITTSATNTTTANGAPATESSFQQGPGNCAVVRPANGSSSSSSNSNGNSGGRASGAGSDIGQPQYNSYHYFHYNHHQPYGDYEESFEMHERVGKESMLLRADTPLKTRYWLQMLRYHSKDLGQWRLRRNGLPNIMMMRHE